MGVPPVKRGLVKKIIRCVGVICNYDFMTDTDFAFGPHQKWCELLRKNVLSRVVHAISGVIP